MPRSLQVQSQYLPLLKSALLRNGFPSQKLLAEALELSPSTVSNFLNGKPVDYLNFLELCHALGKEWRDLADLTARAHSPQSDAGDFPRRTIVLRYQDACPATVGQEFQNALKLAGHDVLCGDDRGEPGDHLAQANYWILLLAPACLGNELLLESVRYALNLREQQGQPHIFPLWCAGEAAPVNLCQSVLQLLNPLPLWCWTGHLASLVGHLLPLLKEGRSALPLNHPWTMAWEHLDQAPGISSPPATFSPPRPLEWPEGQVPLNSPFYVDRPPIEVQCQRALAQPGSLIRIRAPRQMGKSSLLLRIAQWAQQQGDRPLSLNLQLANRRVFTNSDTFLQWFCASLLMNFEAEGVDRSGLERISEGWQLAPLIGSNQCCKAFLEQYLLGKSAVPITLILDAVDRVFEYPDLADDFLGLLRALHEEAKYNPRWQRLRLVIAHATEVYIPLDLNKSPFNVGVPIELPDLTAEQVQGLAERYQLRWSPQALQTLAEAIGGHPYLVRLAFHHAVHHALSPEDLLTNLHTEAGIYRDHLRRQSWYLETHPPLLAAMQRLLAEPEGLPLPSTIAFQLQSLGLTNLVGNHSQVRYTLYHRYFSDRLPASSPTN
ncbi:MAG: AAA-like domain-containing protein [Prochlorotrichaceae cyanobacterium]|jgi:transcriptional regulator with XRE-family HTH domain